MNREELLIALIDWKAELTDEDWNSWVEYKGTQQYTQALEQHGNERMVAIYFFCSDIIQNVINRYK